MCLDDLCDVVCRALYCDERSRKAGGYPAVLCQAPPGELRGGRTGGLPSHQRLVQSR